VPLYFPDWLVLRELSRDVAAALQSYAGAELLDIGCGDKPYARSAPNVRRWIGFDADSNAEADVHGKADALPFPEASFDTVLCTQVLEHVPMPGAVVAECARVLRPGGMLIVSVPQYWELHEEPHDYYRFTPIGIATILQGAGFNVVRQVREGQGPAVAGQALNLSIQHWAEHRWFGRSVLWRAAKVPVYLGINVMSVLLGWVIRSDRDALNILTVAQKSARGNATEVPCAR
jgi:SAM-dependent methyltransferase